MALGTGPPGPGPAVVHPTHYFPGSDDGRVVPTAPVGVSDTGIAVEVAADTAGAVEDGTAVVVGAEYFKQYFYSSITYF